MPWYLFGKSWGGWGHGPYSDRGPAPAGAKTGVATLNRASDWRESDVESKCFFSSDPLRGKYEVDPDNVRED